MGACAAVLTSALPCSSSAEEVIVQSEQMAGRVPGVSVSLEMSEAVPGSPSPLLEAVLAGKKMDLERAQAIARDIAKPDYSLGQYYQDLLAAFPELHLFGLRGIGVSIEEAHAAGGRAAADEFQRTIGAFFAIYWLTRLDSDGKAGFCHGVDESWRPQEAFNEKSRAFFEDAEIWKYFQDLMVDAGLLEQGTKRVDPETTLALLVLTALHDIMKINLLLPSVQKSDAPYRGYSEAEVVADHDVAIFYIVERYTHLLPSLRRLQPSLQLLVQNVLSGLAFNNGWFVQAEAPPGAVFRGIKAAVSAQTESARKVGRRDLSLYFVHWLTDLAGGEPTPLFGCSKLCTLPMHVLKSFMQSVRYIQQLADRTETEVMEDYLKDRWANHQPSVGPMVSGPAGLAKARLLCMAQGNATEVLAAFEKLSDEDKEVLSVEMARTGAEQQSFSDSFVPSSVREQTAGPAFLVYYGPAFLQRRASNPSREPRESPRRSMNFDETDRSGGVQ
ncbi:unnamed protein product [Effrenium voratum]|nr:unnamed protein product [Effrenium voratum]